MIRRSAQERSARLTSRCRRSSRARARARKQTRDSCPVHRNIEADERRRTLLVWSAPVSLSPVARMRRYSAYGVFECARGRDRHPATRRAAPRRALCIACGSLIHAGLIIHEFDAVREDVWKRARSRMGYRAAF